MLRALYFSLLCFLIIGNANGASPPADAPDRWALVKKWRVTVTAEITGSDKKTSFDNGGQLEQEQTVSLNRSLKLERVLNANSPSSFQSRKEIEDHAPADGRTGRGYVPAQAAGLQ